MMMLSKQLKTGDIILYRENRSFFKRLSEYKSFKKAFDRTLPTGIGLVIDVCGHSLVSYIHSGKVKMSEISSLDVYGIYTTPEYVVKETRNRLEYRVMFAYISQKSIVWDIIKALYKNNRDCSNSTLFCRACIAIDAPSNNEDVKDISPNFLINKNQKYIKKVA